MRIAALVLAIFTIVVSIAGIISPESMMTVRRSYYTPSGLYIGGAVRVGMGLVLILAASNSRWPKILRVLGAMMCMQGIMANILGLERARTVLAWEALHPTLLLLGAGVALVSGCFIAVAVTTRASEDRRNVAH